MLGCKRQPVLVFYSILCFSVKTERSAYRAEIIYKHISDICQGNIYNLINITKISTLLISPFVLHRGKKIWVTMRVNDGRY